MKLYCASCGRLVGDVTGMVRRNAVMVCSACLERYKSADAMALMARAEASKTPEFFNQMFPPAKKP
jgi:hypothetical protein